MSLPPGFLDELRTRLSIGQVVGRKVMWDSHKSNQGKGDLWAPCPFHDEKTASFHVDDRKGYYYCFGCHAKGDAISFVRETENVSFMEAVKILADEVGMPMPARDPGAQEKADRRSRLIEIMEMAAQFFRLQLQTGAGAEARAYLAGRGLSPKALEHWEIGLAPEGWQNLWDHLRGKGVAEDLILACGLAKPSRQGQKPYDTFRHRIMFPIRDATGRAIAFGGRALDPADNAKYLNSPETELFDKSRTLFNFKPAREATGKGQPLIVAEGYMDVIALSEAGFKAAIAPLGTAITETQLQMMWRISPEPIIMLDGDLAGQRAAMRAIDLALPVLEAGKSLRFASLPEGLDPDDLIKAQGAGAVAKLLGGAEPMVNLLWRRETERKTFDSPERKAALDKALRNQIAMIKDASIRGHYGQAIKELRWELFSPKRNRGGSATWRSKNVKLPPQSDTKSSPLATDIEMADKLRESVIFAVLIRNPLILGEFYAQLERMHCTNEFAVGLRNALLRAEPSENLLLTIIPDIGEAPLEKLFEHPHVAITPAVRRPDNGDIARMCLAEEFAKLAARRGHAHEVEDAIEELSSDLADERLTARLAQSVAAVSSAGKQDGDDRAEYDTAENGARIKKDERSAFDRLLNQIGFAANKDQP